MPNNKPSSLGRGLNSLIPQKLVAASDDISESAVPVQPSVSASEEFNNGEAELRYVSVDAIEPNPQQPRISFNEEALAELADSVREHGVLQPVVVSETENGRYQIIMGERRWRAAQAAGLMKVPVIVRVAAEREKLELALIENIMREDLNPIELAHAYRRYVDEFGLTHEAAAARLGKSRSVISNTIRLLQLPEEIKTALTDGRLSDAHAKVILGLPTASQQIACFKSVVERGLTVARTRVAIQKMGGSKEARVKVDARDDEMEKKLRQHLGTRVSIQRSGYRGKIVIEFFNYDEMADIVEKILGEE
jgi:ParB family chromosome partitioning protein